MAGRGWPGMGGGGRGVGKIAGVDVPWEYDADLKIDTKPSELFPSHTRTLPTSAKPPLAPSRPSMDLPHIWISNISAEDEEHKLIIYQPNPPPVAPPPRRDEKIAVARYRALRERIHEGPLYTVLGEHSRITKSRSSNAAVVIDPFEGMPTYGQKYKKQHRKIPRLDTRPYIMRFFPEELWTTLDPTTKAGASAALKRRRKTLKIALSTKLTRLEELEEDGDLGRDDDEDMDKDEDAEGEHPEEEEQDDDFEEDEDDDDDYNAENYFDNGEDDDYGDEGGGGDDYDF